MLAMLVVVSINCVYKQGICDNHSDMDNTRIEKILGLSTDSYSYFCQNWSSVGNATSVNRLRSRQNGRHFAGAFFEYNFLYANFCLSFQVSLNFVTKGNTPALISVMEWCQICEKPLSGAKWPSSLTHVCITRPQCDKCYNVYQCIHNAGSTRHIHTMPSHSVNSWYKRYGNAFHITGPFVKGIHESIHLSAVDSPKVPVMWSFLFYMP